MNLYALALVMNFLLGWPIIVGIVVAAAVVLAYITIGGLSSAIYNEVLQFWVIIAALIPLVIVALHDVGGWGGLTEKFKQTKVGEAGLHVLQGTAPGHVVNPIGASWIGIGALSGGAYVIDAVCRGSCVDDMSALDRPAVVIG